MLKSLLTALVFLSGPLAAETKILAFAGSTRQDSSNKKLVIEASEIARKLGANVTFIDLKDYPIPFYDGDVELAQGMPENVKKLRKLMIASNAMIIASPEYNGSVSAVLKNFIDWASRSEDGKPSREAFAGKKIAIMSSSPGQGGGARGLVHLRTILENIGGEVVSKQLTVPKSYQAFSAEGKLTDPVAKQELTEEIQQLF